MKTRRPPADAAPKVKPPLLAAAGVLLVVAAALAEPKVKAGAAAVVAPNVKAPLAGGVLLGVLVLAPAKPRAAAVLLAFFAGPSPVNCGSVVHWAKAVPWSHEESSCLVKRGAWWS